MAAALYTPQVLALATGLAAWPWDAALPMQASARSPSCGSALTVGLALDDRGRIARLGLKPQACAVGQAAAAIFAGHAPGLDLPAIAAARDAIAAWLAAGEDAGLPHWPGLEAIAAARGYPGRHAAILLPWRAACEAMAATAPVTTNATRG